MRQEPHRRPLALRQSLSALIAPLVVGLLGCGDLPAPAAGGRIAIDVAPLSLGGITDARYQLTVTNGPAGGGEILWQRTVSADRFGDGAGSLSYTGPCDADTGTNTVTLILEALYEGAGVEIDPGTYVNPTPISRELLCLPDQDVGVTFDMTIARAAQQGFFDIAVAFEDVFCSAKLDCVVDNGAADLELLHNPQLGGQRDMTAVLAFACAASTAGGQTYLYMDDPVITCDGLGGQNITVDATGAGNIDLSQPPNANPGDYLFGAAVYRGREGLSSVAYWNLDFGLDEPRFAAAGRCVLHGRATASSTAWPQEPEGFPLPAGSVYPVVDWNVTLSDAGGRLCTRHAVNVSGSDVATTYLGYQGAPNQFTWAPSPVYLAHRYEPATGEVLSASAGSCDTCLITGAQGSSSDGQVHLSWTPAAAPMDHTRVVRKQGSFPTSPADGIVVTDTSAAATAYDDGGPALWSTWYYALFATDTAGTTFGPAAEVGSEGIFVSGARRCPGTQLLVGVDGSGALLCQTPQLDTDLDCVTIEQSGGAPGQAATALCPTGYHLTGGGFVDIDQSDGGDAGDEFASHPNPSGDGWTVRFEDEVGGFTAYARCCKGSDGVTLPAVAGGCPGDEAVSSLTGATGPSDGLTCAPIELGTRWSCQTASATGGTKTAPVSAACPTGTTMVGGGFVDIDQDGGGSAADNFESAPSAESWRVTFGDEVGGFDVEARCCALSGTHATNPGPIHDVIGTESCSEANSLTGGWIDHATSWTHHYPAFSGSIASATLTIDIGDADGANITLRSADDTTIGVMTGGDNGGPGSWRCPDAWGGGQDQTLAIPSSLYDDLADGTFAIHTVDNSSAGLWGVNRAILDITFDGNSTDHVQTNTVGTETCSEGQSLSGGWIDTAKSWTHSYAPISEPITSATLNIDIGDADGGTMTLRTSDGALIGTISGGDNGTPGSWRCPYAWGGGQDLLLEIPPSLFPDLADGSFAIDMTPDGDVSVWGTNRAILTIVTSTGCGADRWPIGIASEGDGYRLVCGAATQMGLTCQSVTQSGGDRNTAVSAGCPAGTWLTGGGFSDIDQEGGGSSADEFASWPDGVVWTTRFDDEVDTFSSHARCCALRDSVTFVAP